MYHTFSLGLSYNGYVEFIQACKEVRPATDEELPSSYVEEYRYKMIIFIFAA